MDRNVPVPSPPLNFALGPLEKEVMYAVWTAGPGNVHEIASNLGRKLAYTTVMTTLARLHKKGLLHSDMVERAFVYSARVGKDDWRRNRTCELIRRWLSGPREFQNMLLSSFIDIIGRHDANLLDELEAEIQRKREELSDETSATAEHILRES